jgi:hypothetical protein
MSALVEKYKYPSHKVDWYIDELGTVIEIHGRQHYQITNFGNIPYLDAYRGFNNIRYRDNMKKTALIEAGFEYREIHYKQMKQMTPELIKEIVLNGDD